MLLCDNMQPLNTRTESVVSDRSDRSFGRCLEFGFRRSCGTDCAAARAIHRCTWVESRRRIMRIARLILSHPRMPSVPGRGQGVVFSCFPLELI